ncbi:MAG: hypothetical protein HS116_04345 [Planctomycetes bacterium]|nr:hypothetical protein [Planctomycetota bacterium]
MTPDEAREWLAATPLDRMEVQTRKEVEAALARDPEVANEAEFDRFVEEGLRPLRSRGSAREAVLQRLRLDPSRLPGSRRRSRRGSVRLAAAGNRRALALAAAILLCAAGGIWFWSARPSTPVEPEVVEAKDIRPLDLRPVEPKVTTADPELDVADEPVPSAHPQAPEVVEAPAPKARPEPAVKPQVPDWAEVSSGSARWELAGEASARATLGFPGGAGIPLQEADLRVLPGAEGKPERLAVVAREGRTARLLDLGSNDGLPKDLGEHEALPLEPERVYLLRLEGGGYAAYYELRVTEFTPGGHVELDWLPVPTAWALTRITLARQTFEEAAAQAELDALHRRQNPEQADPAGGGGVHAKPVEPEKEKVKKVVKPLGRMP